MRVTLDSTILVRATPRVSGPARALLLELLQQGHCVVLSGSVLDEVERVLHYPRLVKRFGLTEQETISFLVFLAASGEMVGNLEPIAPPIRDLNDVHILQTAISGKVEYLCTLDEHFYDPPVIEFCRSYGITVISDLDLLQIIRSSQP